MRRKFICRLHSLRGILLLCAGREGIFMNLHMRIYSLCHVRLVFDRSKDERVNYVRFDNSLENLG